jgi:hypothetical protein
MKNSIFTLTFVFSIFLLFSACEKNTTLKLADGKAQLAIEAYITDQEGPQTIKLTLTQAFLDNSTPPAASGAKVSLYIPDSLLALSPIPVPDEFKKFNFIEDGNTGNYICKDFPLGFKTIPLLKKLPYELKVEYQNETFTGVSFLDSVPQIDSLTFEFTEQQINGSDTINPGWRVTDLFCKDLPGKDNCYWFRTFRNNKLFNRPEEINLSYDGTFGPGSDGLNFIPPIAFNITPGGRRFNLGDKFKVEIHSFSPVTYGFLQLMQSQMQNNGLFATPPVNVFCNMTNINPNSKAKAVGHFALVAIATKEVVIIDKKKFNK